MSAAVQRCAECGSELPPHVPAGLCPHCALQSVLPVAPAESPALPRSFGDYELLDEIARGGMGIVYRARQKSLDRIVAVKLLLLGQYASEEFIHRFRIEASAAASLQHPNIVAIHEVGVHQGQHYFAMDFVDGPDLAQLVRDQPLTAKRAAGYVKTIAEAIHFAHTRRILHRDLKPSNVLIDSNDQPRVTDFGLAKNLANDSELTLSGQVMGSPSFMPPEQALGDRGKMGPASDVYSLGAILYHALTGRAPFVGQSVADTLQQVESQEPIAPRLLIPAIPADLETICLKCLEKEPGKRFEAAQELSDELDRFLRDEPIHSRPVSAPEKIWRWCRRKPLVASLGTATLVLLLAVSVGAPITAFRIDHARQELEKHLYVSDVRQASQAIEDYDLLGARERLERIAASPHQRKMRGWEWRYLMGRCRSDEMMTLGRHDSAISGLALSPDNKWAASISEDGLVKIWDFVARKEVSAWQAHTEPAEHGPGMPGQLAFSPDGQTLATGGRDRLVRLWTVATRQNLAEMEKLDGPCTGLAFSRDGSVLAAVSITGEISLWSPSLSNNSPALLNRWNVNARLTFVLALSADGKSLAIAGEGERARLWDISEPRTPRELPAFDGTGFPMAISPDGKSLVAAGSGAHVLRRWALPAREERPRWPERKAQFISLAFSSDGLVLASGHSDGGIVLRDMAGEREPVTLMGHEKYVTALAFSHDGRLLISAGRDKTVRLWEVSQGEGVERIVPHGFSAVAVCFSRDSRYLATVARDRTPMDDGSIREQHTLKRWEVSSMREIEHAPIGGIGYFIYPTFAPDGKFLAVDEMATHLQIHAVPSLRMVTNLAGANPNFSTNGRSMLHASGRRIVRRDSPAAADAVEIVIGESSSKIYALALSPDDNTVACAGEGDFSVQFWDARRRGQLGTAKGHERRVVKLTFSPDGQQLASASWDGKVGIWDVGKRRLIELLHAHSGELYSVAFSPDGRTLASCGSDATVRLWNTRTWQEIATLRGGATLAAVAFSLDSRWLAAAANDGTIHVWRAPSWAEIGTAANSQ